MPIFISSGSEGTEAALKLARQYFLEIGQPQRTRFIARRQSYHGNTLGALAAGGNAMRRAPYAPILADAFSHVSPCFAYRHQDSGRIGRGLCRAAGRGAGGGVPAPRAAERHRVHRRAGGRRHHRLRHRAARLFPGDARDVRPARRAADPRRGDVRHGAHRHHACLGAGGRLPRYPGDRQGAGRRLPADRRHPDRTSASSPRCARGSGAFMHGHTYQAHPGRLRRGAGGAEGDRARTICSPMSAPWASAARRGAAGALRQPRAMSATSAGAACSRRSSWWPTARRKEAFDPKLRLYDRVREAALERGPVRLPDGRHDRRQARRPRGASRRPISRSRAISRRSSSDWASRSTPHSPVSGGKRRDPAGPARLDAGARRADRDADARPARCAQRTDRHARSPRRSPPSCAWLNAHEIASVLVLTGAGSAFSAGGNVKHMRDRDEGGSFAGDVYTVQNRTAPASSAWRLPCTSLEMPSIAAVNGAAIGAGCDLATHVRHPAGRRERRNSPRASSISASSPAMAAAGSCSDGLSLPARRGTDVFRPHASMPRRRWRSGWCWKCCRRRADGPRAGDGSVLRRQAAAHGADDQAPADLRAADRTCRTISTSAR